MEVLEQEDKRAAIGQSLDDLLELAEQLHAGLGHGMRSIGLVRIRALELRGQLDGEGECFAEDDSGRVLIQQTRQFSQDFGKRLEWPLTKLVIAVADDRKRALTLSGGEQLAGEPCLADSRLAANEDQSPGAIRQALQ